MVIQKKKRLFFCESSFIVFFFSVCAIMMVMWGRRGAIHLSADVRGKNGDPLTTWEGGRDREREGERDRVGVGSFI